MIKPDWDIFKSKFSENPQFNFEWLCYLLFCKEFSKPYGIFRYKNQSAIETDPIEVDGSEIGFQAKFYNTALSSHKGELLEALVKAKRDYPNIGIFRIYTNQEWGQAYTRKPQPVKAIKPQGLVEIESKAEELNIEIQWNTLSYFESNFVTVECESIVKNFFLEDKTVFDFIAQQELHTQAILSQIHDSMSFNGNVFSLERNNILDELKANANQVSILSGLGGVGKTVEIKKLYEDIKEDVPFYVFKATEFELNRLNDFSNQGSIYEFIECYGDSDKKIIVIDSAEKLLDLSNQEPAKEFITLILEKGWQIIFTTRDHYFDDLNFLCMEVYKVAPLRMYIKELEMEDLYDLSDKYGFTLPSDNKLIELLRIPLYLSEYLSVFHNEKSFDYLLFKTRIWDAKVKKGSAKREQAFIIFALKRANEGCFFLKPDDGYIDVAEELSKDGLLGYDNTSFFITHDIYEEWALEKFINTAFINRSSTQSFFESIGRSLPIRRSFRSWVSENLLLNDDGVKAFLEELIENNDVQPFWKDEIIVSILLSDYSKVFFENFENELLDQELELVRRICFMLRIACKEVDDEILKKLGIKLKHILPYSYIFTKPKGKGWSAFIKFVYEHFDQIGSENIGFIMPVLFEWNSKVKKGSTTKLASLIAIKYYKWIQAEDIYISNEGSTSSLIKTIVYGVSEIKGDLSAIVSEIALNKFNGHQDPYNSLSKFILSEIDGIAVAKELPSDVLILATLFWNKDYSNDLDSYRSREVELIYGITDDYDLKYYPESAFQTPMFWLLQSDLKSSIDFILEFVNKVTASKVKHYGDGEFHRVKVEVDNCELDQFMDNQLWGAYRGAGNTPSLLSSVLMALEKFFLDFGEMFKDDSLESWLLYLLKKSNSTAISGVVTSVVLAFPDKTFNVAKVLFRVKEFFDYDTQRMVFDSSHKSQLSGLNSMFGRTADKEYLQKERIDACDAKHRKLSLETLFLHYQCFRSEPVSEEDVVCRQNELWGILDQFYRDLPEDNESEDIKIWKICLARMDRRKMDIKTEVVEGGVAIHWNPELESALREYSEKSLTKLSESHKYIPLKLWAEQKIRADDGCKKYEQYESSPEKALAEAKEIVESLNKLALVAEGYATDESFYLLNHSTPIYVCATLIKFYKDILSKEELIYCIDIIFDSIKTSVEHNYRYQVGDGIDACFFVIPELVAFDSSILEEMKFILLLALFKNDSVAMLGSERFNGFAINVVHQLWKTNERDAESLLTGYLMLMPKYFELMDKLHQESYAKDQYDVNYDSLHSRFIEENEVVINNMRSNLLNVADAVSIDELTLSAKQIALQLIPNNANKPCKALFFEIVSSAAGYLVTDNREHRPDYTDKHDFLKKYAQFILAVNKKDIPKFLGPFLQNVNSSEGTSDLIEAFVLAQDGAAAYENFWLVWNLLQPKIIEIAKSSYGYHRKEKIIKAYLFALSWKESTEDWHTFKPKDKKFFKNMSIELASCKATLYSISKLLNDIGSCYLNEGVHWIASIIRANPGIIDDELDPNTIYYMDTYIKKYMYENRQLVKRSKQLKDEVLVILDFLVSKGEVSGYLLRENVV